MKIYNALDHILIKESKYIKDSIIKCIKLTIPQNFNYPLVIYSLPLD